MISYEIVPEEGQKVPAFYTLNRIVDGERHFVMSSSHESYCIEKKELLEIETEDNEIVYTK
jgi:hypothetical protein